jgi:methyl-accepting chemotaxis protein
VASREQSSGVNEISKAIAEIDQVTHMNSSSATQGSSSARVLAEQTLEMDRLVTQLTTTVDGAAAAS